MSYKQNGVYGLIGMPVRCHVVEVHREGIEPVSVDLVVVALKKKQDLVTMWHVQSKVRQQTLI